MAHLLIAQGLAGDLPLNAAFTLALIWGHMAATSCRALHLLAYAGLLLAQISQVEGDPVASGEHDESFATALAIIDAVADAGHGRAEVISFALASRVSPTSRGAKGVRHPVERQAPTVRHPISHARFTSLTQGGEDSLPLFMVATNEQCASKMTQSTHVKRSKAWSNVAP